MKSSKKERAFSREDIVFLANISLDTLRFNTMLKYVKKFCKNVEELPIEERNLFGIAYKQVI